MVKSQQTLETKEELVRIWLAILMERYGRKENRENRYNPKPVGWLESPKNTDGLLDSI